jgi:NTE family protein
MIKLILTISLLIYVQTVLFAQNPYKYMDHSAQEVVGPKVGLVLSGGGVKGISHIALLKAFEEVNMPIDFIAGTSMGAIVGGLYAIGYSADELEEIVQHADWEKLLSDNVSRRYIPIEEKQWDSMYIISLPIQARRVSLPTGLISGQEISKMLARLTLPVHGITDFNTFPIPFVAIATNLADGEPIVMRSGHLPDVLRSSMAFPSVFAPHEIYGKRTIDGGVARNFPVTDVIDMGADYIIGINVSDTEPRSDTLSNILSILDRTVNYKIAQTTLDQAKLVDLLIEPDIGSYNLISFEAIPEIIQKSNEWTQQYKPRLQGIADSLNSLRSHSFNLAKVEQIDSVYVVGISIHDHKLTQERVVLSELGIEP